VIDESRRLERMAGEKEETADEVEPLKASKDEV
jgi:hypothetical protein